MEKLQDNNLRPISQLMMKPVKSCLQADVQLANAAYRYIRDTGFVRSRQYMDVLHVVTVSFTYYVNCRKQRITIPLLTLVPVEMLQIDRARLSFVLNYDFNSDMTLSATYGNANGNGWGYNAQTRFAQQMKMNVTVGRYEPLLGLKRLLNYAVSGCARIGPFNPSEHRPLVSEHVAGICNILQSLKNHHAGKVYGLLQAYADKLAEFDDKSPMLLRYLKLRKLPIEDRAYVPYKIIVRDKRIIYSSVCREGDGCDSWNFSGIWSDAFSYSDMIVDIVDAEDLLLAQEKSLTTDLMLEHLGKVEYPGMDNANHVNFLNAAIDSARHNAIDEICSSVGISLRENYAVPCTSVVVSALVNGTRVLLDFLPSGQVLSNNDEQIEKRATCMAAGYELLSFRENLLIRNPRLVSSIIASKLRRCHNRVNADKCRVVKLSKEIANMFHRAYNPLGAPDECEHIGLHIAGKLLSVMSLRKCNQLGDYEIARVSTRYMYHIVCGDSRMLRNFIRQTKWKSIVFYSDTDFSNGNTMEQLGFKKVEETTRSDRSAICTTYTFILTPADTMPAVTHTQSGLVSRPTDIAVNYLKIISVVDSKDRALAEGGKTLLESLPRYSDRKPYLREAIAFVCSEVKVKLTENFAVPATPFKVSALINYTYTLIDIIPEEKLIYMSSSQADKRARCLAAGYNLLTFSDTFVINHPRLVASIVASKLRRCNCRVFAKNCKVGLVHDTIANQFHRVYNPKGSPGKCIHVGLQSGGTLLCVLSVKRLSRYDYEIVRISTRHMHYVVGGTSRMLSFFIRSNEWSNIMAYNNNDINLGESLLRLGFRKISTVYSRNTLCGSDKYRLTPADNMPSRQKFTFKNYHGLGLSYEQLCKRIVCDMMKVNENDKFLFLCRPMDMRAGVDVLTSFIIRSGYNPRNGNAYIFMSADKDTIKVLRYELGGYAIYYRRLDSSRFSVPFINKPGFYQLPWKDVVSLLVGSDYVP